MNGDGTRVLVMLGDSHATRLLVEDLASGGFVVERAKRARDALAFARARRPAAIVATESAPFGWRRALAREPGLASVPLVGVTWTATAKPRWLPFLTPVRWDRVLLPHEVHLRGRPAGALRDVIARGPRAPATERERLGARLCRIGSALLVVAFLLLGWNLAGTFRGTAGPGSAAVAWWIALFGAAHVCGDVGVRLLRGLRPGLSATTWVWVALAVVFEVARAVTIVR